MLAFYVCWSIQLGIKSPFNLWKGLRILPFNSGDIYDFGDCYIDVVCILPNQLVQICWGSNTAQELLNTREYLATGNLGNNLKYVKKKKREVQSNARNIHDETNTKKGSIDDIDSEDEVSFENFDKNLKDQFELEAICLIAQVGISCNTFHEQVLSALWNMFKHDISLLVDKTWIFCLVSEGRPRGKNWMVLFKSGVWNRSSI